MVSHYYLKVDSPQYGFRIPMPCAPGHEIGAEGAVTGLGSELKGLLFGPDALRHGWYAMQEAMRLSSHVLGAMGPDPGWGYRWVDGSLSELLLPVPGLDRHLSLSLVDAVNSTYSSPRAGDIGRVVALANPTRPIQGPGVEILYKQKDPVDEEGWYVRSHHYFTHADVRRSGESAGTAIWLTGEQAGGLRNNSHVDVRLEPGDEIIISSMVEQGGFYPAYPPIKFMQIHE